MHKLQIGLSLEKHGRRMFIVANRMVTAKLESLKSKEKQLNHRSVVCQTTMSKALVQ